MEVKGEPKLILPPPPEGVYTYVAVKGILSSADAIVFGLTTDEIHALLARYERGNIEYTNGIHIKVGPLNIVNALAQLGYRVVCSTGEIEVTWTLQREL